MAVVKRKYLAEGNSDMKEAIVSTEEKGPTYPSVRELAEDLNIGYQSAYKALRDGTIPSIRVGKRFIIPRSAVAEWLRNAGQAS
jgi:excisionase family DNA binding protein